jgi:hypothetical protein
LLLQDYLIGRGVELIFRKKSSAEHLFLLLLLLLHIGIGIHFYVEVIWQDLIDILVGMQSGRIELFRQLSFLLGISLFLLAFKVAIW